jgi:hypothetical protein
LLSNVLRHAATDIRDWHILARRFPDTPVPAEMTQSMRTTGWKTARGAPGSLKITT